MAAVDLSVAWARVKIDLSHSIDKGLSMTPKLSISSGCTQRMSPVVCSLVQFGKTKTISTTFIFFLIGHIMYLLDFDVLNLMAMRRRYSSRAKRGETPPRLHGDSVHELRVESNT